MKEEVTNVVYVHNFKNVLQITRDTNGIWKWQSTFEKCRNHFTNWDNYKQLTWKDNFELGRVVGMELSELLIKCKKDYGDEE